MSSLQDINFGDGNIGDGILSAIFGDNWNNMFGEGPTSSISALLIDVFQVYNSAVMLGAAVVVGYALWAGTTQTAHEAQVMGKRFSSLWMPLRMALAAALVAPVFGLSLVQMLVLSVAGLGFQTADTVANIVATHVAQGNALTTFPSFYDKEKNDALFVLMQLETCAAFKEKEQSELSWGGWKTDMGPKLDADTIQYGEKAALGLGDSSCGSITANGYYAETVALDLYKAAATLRPVAQSIVEGEETDNGYSLHKAKQELAMLDKKIAAKAKQEVDKDTQAALDAFKADVESKGWIGLGGWYMTLSKQTAKFNDKVAYSFSTSVQNHDDIEAEPGGLLGKLSQAAQYCNRNGISVQDSSTDDAMRTVADSAISLLQGSGDPFLRMVQLGHYCTQTAAVLGGSKVALKGLGWIAGKVGGAGGALVEGATDILSNNCILSNAVILCFLVVGALAGWVLPLLPYSTWVFGVCSVFVGILQSVLAAPIWAAAHAMPEGEGIAGTHAKQGYMLVMNLALRPVLITCGFIFSYFLLWGMSWLFLELLKSWLVSNATDSPGFDYLNFFVGLCVGLLVAVLGTIIIASHCFGFIFQAADEVLTWVGGHAQLGADRGGAQQMMGAVMAAPGQAGRLGRGVQGALAGAGAGASRMKSDVQAFQGAAQQIKQIRSAGKG